MVFFGVAAAFGSTDLYVRHGDVYANRSADHVQRQLRQGKRGQTLFSDVPAAPWVMLGIGVGLLLQAAIARSVLLG
jgi:hypothetical protein